MIALYGKYMFNFVRNCQTVFQSDQAILPSASSVFNSPYPYQPLVWSVKDLGSKTTATGQGGASEMTEMFYFLIRVVIM